MRIRANLPSTLTAIAIASLLAGCSRPAVAPKPPAFQQSAEALRDWQAVAKQIALDMQRDGFLPSPSQPASVPRPPYYVRVARSDSQFLREVAESLNAEILSHGGAVSSVPGAGAELDLDVDVVRWSPRDAAPDGTGTIAGLAGGTAVLLANQPPLPPAAGFGILAGAGILADILRTMTPNTNTEIAWGASIRSGNRIVFDVRYPMYIADADKPMYVPDPPPPPVQVVQLRYAP